MTLRRKTFRIIRGVGGNYWASDPDGQVLQVKAPGIFRNSSQKPLVGDLVICEATGDPLIPYVMVEICPRFNSMDRPALANIDELWLIIPLHQPEPDLWMLDKMLTIAFGKEISTRIIFTKADLAEDVGRKLSRIYVSAGYPVVLSSPDDEKTKQLLLSLLKNKLVAFSGPSGAGKSTLLNFLLGGIFMETGEISDKLQRGKHTTRHAEIFPCAGGFIADTPGFSSLDLFQAGVTEENLVRSYAEIWAEQDSCRFLSCKHLSEPGCAVRSNPSIDPGRLERYQEFRRELARMKPYERKV